MNSNKVLSVKIIDTEHSHLVHTKMLYTLTYQICLTSEKHDLSKNQVETWVKIQHHNDKKKLILKIPKRSLSEPN